MPVPTRSSNTENLEKVLELLHQQAEKIDTPEERRQVAQTLLKVGLFLAGSAVALLAQYLAGLV